MSAPDEPGVHVVRAGNLSEATAQTPGMTRRAGIDPSISRGLWVGRVATGPGFNSGVHHHGEAETVGHVLEGRARIRYGDGYKSFVDLDPGDFIYIGPYVPHIEENLSDTEPLEFVTIRSPDNIVVNLE
ncbi:MAG: cupin domain-containing protein [Propionibacteriales bacterium]|nr:cupin domain-containing protein [Propionibacteriales bacterium]